MREEDLIPAFISELESMRPFRRNDRAKVREIKRAMRKADYFQSEDASYDLNETLFDLLNSYALPYFYFGAHPGDGADYGFWLSDSFQDDFEGLKVSDLSEVPQAYSGEVLLVNDHGNMTLYSYSRGKSREIWGIV
jgi:hypothetical protein